MLFSINENGVYGYRLRIGEQYVKPSDGPGFRYVDFPRHDILEIYFKGTTIKYHAFNVNEDRFSFVEFLGLANNNWNRTILYNNTQFKLAEICNNEQN